MEAQALLSLSFDAISTLIGIIVGILLAGLPVAFEWGRRRGRQAKREEVLKEVRNAIQSTRLVDFCANPLMLRRGDQITLEYTIDGSSTIPVEVWLGASLHAPDGKEFYQTDQDRVVKIGPGRHSYRRAITPDMSVKPGIYQLHVQVWFGEASDSERSIVVASRSPACDIRID